MFVANRVKKLAETAGPFEITRKYYPSDLNPADLGSRGAAIAKMERGNWFTGPDWLLDETAVATAAKAEHHQSHR